MKEEIISLVELQEIDSAIAKKTENMDALPKKISTVEHALKDVQAVYDRQKQQCEALEKKKKDKERMLDDINEKVKKLKSRASEIKTNKEYQAHLKEIEQAEKERFAVEDEILSLMETVDVSSKELKNEEARVRVEKEKIEAFKKKLEEEVSMIEQEVEGLKLRRKEHVTAIDKDLYALYFKLLENKRGLAIAEARNEICRGCNMNIPPQLYVELRRIDKIHTCPQCGRILYWKEEASSQ